jgi:acetyl-CoA synthetase
VRGSGCRLRRFLGQACPRIHHLENPFTQALDESNAPFFKWFADGKLNVSYNCLDRNVEAGLGDKVAIIFEADNGEVTKVTYKELLAKVCKFANRCVPWVSRRVTASSSTADDRRRHRRHAGLRPYRRAHSIVFGGFSAQSLRDRINDAGAVC